MKNDEKKVMYLLQKSKKGIFRVLFGRIPIMLSLFVVEILLLLSFYRWFSNYVGWFNVIQGIFMVTMFYRLWNCEKDASSKLTWLMLIAIAPIPGTFFFWLTDSDIGQRLVQKHIQDLRMETRDKLVQDPDVLRKLEVIESGTDDLCRYLQLSGSFPLYQNTNTDYFPSGEKTWESMLYELQKAETFIFLEFFIIDEGYMWGKILRILADKAAAGVDVRVMYDGICELTTLTPDYAERLRKLGIKCKPFSPIHPLFSTLYNYRDHRKILVVDNRVAFTGGVNLADEYINKKERFGHWKDSAIRIQGEAVSTFTLMFLQMWNLIKKDVQWDAFLKPEKTIESDGYVMPYCDCPLDQYKVGESIYVDILYRAKSYVYIMTPYLIPDNTLENAITYAAQRGVDVRIILPGIPDKKIAYALAKSYYKRLVNAGVKIYEYTPGFVHSKVFISDDEKAIVGTINLDYRSLYHHFECAAYLYRTSCIAEIKADFLETQDKCRRVTPDTIRNEKIFYKVVGGMTKFIAPLM